MFSHRSAMTVRSFDGVTTLRALAAPSMPQARATKPVRAILPFRQWMRTRSESWLASWSGGAREGSASLGSRSSCGVVGEERVCGVLWWDGRERGWEIDRSIDRSGQKRRAALFFRLSAQRSAKRKVPYLKFEFEFEITAACGPHLRTSGPPRASKVHAHMRVHWRRVSS